MNVNDGKFANFDSTAEFHREYLLHTLKRAMTFYFVQQTMYDEFQLLETDMLMGKKKRF